MRYQNTRQKYNNLLRSAISNQDFAQAVAVLLERDPLFIPGYLEHMWLADEIHDHEMCQSILQMTEPIIKQIFTSPSAKQHIDTNWTILEVNALQELLNIHLQKNKRLRGRLLARLASLAFGYSINFKTHAFSGVGKYLSLTKIINVTDLQAELNSAATFWWNIYTRRALSITHHQHTHSIVLRALQSDKKELYEPIDGVHESIITIVSYRFPKIHQSILDFAEEHKLGLGRIAIVRMKPGQQSYRHFDSEINLCGRNRYHLVLSAGEDNFLSAGDETTEAKEGEIWFFENHVMHRTHNKSKKPRVHVIFDGYPLET